MIIKRVAKKVFLQLFFIKTRQNGNISRSYTEVVIFAAKK